MANKIIAFQDLSILKYGHDEDKSISKAVILELIRNGLVSQRLHPYIILQLL
jgi:hypothetical protein